MRILRADGSALRFQYDAAVRVVSVTAENQQVVGGYRYGATSARLMSDEGGVRTYYLWSGSAVISEYSESASSGVVQWTKSCVYLGARLLATLMPNGVGGEHVEYHQPDRLGTRLVTNAANTNVVEQVTLPFGTALESESTGATTKRFTTYER